MKIVMNTEYKVENKPVIFGSGRGPHSKYPFDQMEMGQSFFFTADTKKELARIRCAAAAYGTRHQMKFSVIKEGKGYRCGRIA